MSGKLIVFSAPSGSGKTSIVRYLLEQNELNLAFSVSATSRQPRGKEQNGIDYYFLDTETFKQDVSNGYFAEYEEVYKGTFYGTYKKEIKRLQDAGKHVIFDIDVIGGLNLKQIYPDDTLSIFVMPPSIEALEKRLKNRQTDSEDKIKERIAKAEHELSFAQQFDTIIINDRLEVAQKEAYNLIKTFIEH